MSDRHHKLPDAPLASERMTFLGKLSPLMAGADIKEWNVDASGN